GRRLVAVPGYERRGQGARLDLGAGGPGPGRAALRGWPWRGRAALSGEPEWRAGRTGRSQFRRWPRDHPDASSGARPPRGTDELDASRTRRGFPLDADIPQRPGLGRLNPPKDRKRDAPGADIRIGGWRFRLELFDARYRMRPQGVLVDAHNQAGAQQ